jgi:hypothetical protein
VGVILFVAHRLPTPVARQGAGVMTGQHRRLLFLLGAATLFEGYDPGSTKLDLDVRHPFLDLRLIEYLLAIPATPWCVHKHILRRAMKGKLPNVVLNRPKSGLAGDPALQLIRRASVRWLDSFEVSPQLRAFVDLNHRRSIADEETSDGLWASLRVFALNYWLSNSWPMKVEAQVNNSSDNLDLNRLNCLDGDNAWNLNLKPLHRERNRKPKSRTTSRK